MLNLALFVSESPAVRRLEYGLIRMPVKLQTLVDSSQMSVCECWSGQGMRMSRKTRTPPCRWYVPAQQMRSRLTKNINTFALVQALQNTIIISQIC
jgi:hypothetical protein